jgi:hypothetical protein
MKRKPAKNSPVKASKPQSPIRVGNSVLIRSVTHYYTGKIVLVSRDEIVLTEAAWIADTGRFSEAFKTGVFSEIEPYPSAVTVGRGAVCDVTDWPHSLPREVK